MLQGLTLTIVGMSVVFSFLTILVFIMKLMSAFIPKYFPDDKANKQLKIKQKDSNKNQQSPMETAEETGSIGEAEIAAVIAAVKSYSHS